MALKANSEVSSPLSILPQEIIDQFIDALDRLPYDNALGTWGNESRHKDIKSCMQVSRAFRSRARTLLFSEIVIFLQPRPVHSKATENLREILEGDEALAHQVHTVRIQIQVKSLASIPHRLKLAIHDESLPRILEILPSLQTLCLGTVDGRCGWRNLSMDIKNAIFRLQDLPSLTTLKLFGHGLHIPAEVVVRWTNLRKLRVHASPFAYHPLRQSGVPSRIARRQIARLETMECVTFFAMAVEMFVKAAVDSLFERLKNLLAVVYGRRDWVIMRKVLIRVGHSLETFDLANLFSSSTVSENPELLRFEMPFLVLHTLVLREDNVQLDESATNIATFLCAFASSPALTTMRIRIQWNVPPETYSWTPSKDVLTKKQLLDNTSPQAWSSLDAALVHAPLFHVLEFDARFCYSTPVWRAGWGIEATVSRQWTPQQIFPLLSNRDSAPPIVRLSFLQFDL